MNSKIIVLLACLYPCISVAQNIVSKETAEPKDDYLHEFFRTSSGSYLAINYASPHSAFSYKRNYDKMQIVGYDDKLNEKFVSFNKELAGNKYQGVVEVNKQIHVFYAEGNKIASVEINPATGDSKASPVQLLTLKQDPEHFFKGFSPDSNLCFILFDYETDKGKSMQYEGAILDKNLKVVRNLSFGLEKLEEFIANTATVLTNEGSFFMIHGIRTKEKNVFRPFTYHITSIDNEGDLLKTMLQQMPTGWLNNVIWRPAPGGLSFTGVLAKEENSGFKFILSGNFISAEKKLENIKEVSIVDQPWYKTVAEKFTKQTTAGGLYQAARTTKSFINPDGSVIIVMQSVSVSYSARGNHTYTNTFGRYVEVLKVNADGGFGWHHTIPLYQLETSPNYCGVVATQQNNKDIVIAFLDNPKNNTRKPNDDVKRINVNDGGGQPVAVIIKDNGAITRTLIKGPNEPGFFLAPQHPYAGYENEILYTSYNWKSAGKSKYKLGVIKLP